MIIIDLDPVAFLNVRWYGIFVALGVSALILWTLWEVKKGAKVSYDTVITAALVGIPSGVIVAKLLHIIDNIVIAKLHPELLLTGPTHIIDYTQHPELILSGQGLTIYGAVLGAALGVWIYSKFSDFQFGYFTDVITPGIILAQAIGRIGCTLNRCCYGTTCSLPWGIDYGFGPVHPTQIYEIIFLAIIFAVLLKLRGRLEPSGSIFLVYLSLYSLWRIGLDFIREGTPFLFGLHQAQVIAIIVLAITVSLLAYRTHWVPRGSQPDSETE